MTGVRPFRYGRAVLSFVAVMLAFLFIIDAVLISKQRRMMAEEMREHSAEELSLIGTLIQEALLRNDYATAGRFVVQWGEGTPAIAELRAMAPNGFILAHYVRSEPAMSSFCVTEKVSYAGRHLVTLSMTKDFSRQEEQIRGLAVNNVLYSLVFALAFGAAAWFTMRRTALVPMEEMVSEINRVNEGLEQRVRERTEDLVAANRDLEEEIAERKKAERRLAYSESYLRSIIENEPECVKIIDEDGIVLEMNPAGLAMMEADSPEQVIGHSIYQAVPPEHAGRLRAMHRGVLLGKKGSMAFELAGIKGTRRWLETHAVPFHDPHSGRRLILAVTRDITEHRKLEEQLRHAQKMEAIGTLTGGIAHEFNNILTAIMGYGEFLLGEMPASDPNRKYVDIIQTSAQRAARLTEGLLAYSRKQIVHLEPADLNEIIRYVENILSRLVGENINLVVSLSGEALTVMVDKAQIEQVLMNLATNAMDAMPEGGTLSISTERVLLDEEFMVTHPFGKPGPYSLMTVTDTGEGMDKGTIEKIFEPFFTTKQVGKGTGLGLSMTYGIIKKHHGSITVYSEPGMGTTFKVYLPLAGREAAETHPAPPAPAAPPARGTETVLLAEDDPEVRGLIRTTLEKNGYTVVEAADGIEAVEKFKALAGAIDLLLFDIKMPGKSGREAHAEISSLSPGIKTLFISGYTGDLSGAGGSGEGLNIVAKPVLSRELLLSVRKALDAS